MSHALHIGLNVFLSLFGLGFVVWVFWRSLKNSHDPARLVFKWLLTAAVMWLELTVAVPAFVRGGVDAIFIGLGLTGALAMVIDLVWRHAIIELISKPLTNIFDGGSEPPEPKPLYSIALAKRKTNRPLEAVVAIREQLENSPMISKACCCSPTSRPRT